MRFSPLATDLHGRSSVVQSLRHSGFAQPFKPLLACAVFAITLTGAFGITAAHGATLVGAITGSSGVTASGTASYAIPISLPPATKGLQPSVSLVYSSGSGEGLAGHDWTLSGFSAINRCPSTIDEEGQTIAVHLTGPGATSDTFCLDGQRLLYKGGSTYGVEGSTYDTTLEGFSKIVSHVDSSATNGPSWFTVQKNDGRIYEYGNTTDSKIYAQGTTVVRVWALDKVTDLDGNYYTISYDNDATHGDYWPLSISYTGNATAGVSPLHKVTFSWTPRSDNTVQANYLGGSLVTQTQLLNSITVSYNGSATFTYTLSYQTDPANFRNQLASVKECDAAGDCLRPTTIQWQNGAAGWGPDQDAGVSVSDAAHADAAHLMDVDGDGIMDLVYPDTASNDWKVMFGLPGGGFTAPVDTGDPLWGTATFYQYALALDYDGSGRQSLMVPIPTGWQVLVPTGNRTPGAGGIFRTPGNNLPNLSGNNSVTGLPIYEGNVWAVDFFGRGLSDIVYTDGTNVYLQQNGSTTVQSVYALSQTTWKKDTNSTFLDSPLDFDGSGRGGALAFFTTQTECIPDGCKPPPPTSGYQALQASGGTSNPKYTGAGQISAVAAAPEPMDATGGGLTDLLASNGNYLLEVNTNGAGFNTVTTGATDALVLDDVVADYYGDGRQEAIVDYKSGSTAFSLIRLNYSLGSSSFVASVTPVSTALLPNYLPGSLKVGNIEANGLDDLVYVTQASSTQYEWHYRLHNGGAADLVTSITDGLGNTSQFTYASLASGGAVYTEGSSAQYPIKDIQSPMQVVTSDTETDGTGANYTLSYTYSGAQSDEQGRGFLGFSGRTITDSRYSTTETISYRLGFPWTGMVTSDVVARSSDHAPISDIENSAAGQLTYASGNSTTYFPYFGNSASTLYNYSGASQAISTTTVKLKAADFDGNGNVTDSVITTVDGATNQQFTTETQTQYASPDTSSYCLALPSQVTTLRTSPAGTLSRVASTPAANLDTSHCRFTSQVTASGETGDGTPTLTTSDQYDAFGNVIETDISGPGMATRTVQYSFQGGDGEFPTTTTSMVSGAVSLVTHTAWRYDLGLKASDTDANGNATQLTYDGFGRLIQTAKPDGTKTDLTYAWCSAPTPGITCPATGVYEITVTLVGSDGTSLTTGYSAYDMKGRKVEQGTVVTGGGMSLVDTTYDSVGHATDVTRPYFPGQSGPIFHTVYKYAKAFNRLIEIDQPANATDTNSAAYADKTTLGYNIVSGTGYAMTSTRTVSGVTHASTRYTDALGEVVKVVDNNGGQATYAFDPFGDVVSSTNADGNQTTAIYDGLGHKIAMTDPDLGHWTYQVDALGDVVCQTDADNQSIITTYDGIGRITSKLETAAGAGCGATSGTSSTWSYDAAGALGLPAALSDSNGFQRSYAYDTLGRETDVTTTVSGTPYDVSTTYDSFGRVQTVAYPVSATPLANSAPTATAVVLTNPAVAGSSVQIDGSGSMDPSGAELQYQWTQTAGPSLGATAFNAAAATMSFVPTVAGTYTFQLQVIDGDSSLSTPASVSVGVQPATPTAPTATSPNYTGSIGLSWGNTTGATTYQLYESANGTSFSLVKTVNAGSGQTTSASAGGLGDGTYYFEVAACGGGLCSPQGPMSAGITVLLPPNAPTGLSVSPGTSVNGNFTLSWTAPATTTQYRVYQSTNGGNNVWVDTFNNSSSGTISRVEGGLADGSYSFQVAAWNAAGQGPDSAAASGTVLHIPGTPGAASVNPSTVAGGDSFTLSWGRASGTVSYYIVNGNTATHYTGLSATLTAGVKAGTHTYYVQACNASGCGGDSASASLTDTGVGTGCPPPPYQCQLVMSDDDYTAEAVPDQADRLIEPAALAPVVAQAIGLGPTLPTLKIVPEPQAPATVLAKLADERKQLVVQQPRQRTETTLLVAAAYRATMREPTLLPAASSGEVAEWAAGQAEHVRLHPDAPAYAPPAYIAYGGASIEPATTTPYRFTVQYSYDPSSGNLQSVSDANTGFIYWRIASGGGVAPVDASGHLLGYVDGNNVSTVNTYDAATGAVTGISTGIGQSSSVQQLVYTWGPFGNLTQRCDINHNLVENFTYDNLNRLSASSVSNNLAANTCSGGTPGAAIGVSYDAVGNIQNLSNSGNPAVGGAYAYDPNHPDAVSTVANVNPSAPYTYDANGNMVSGNGRTLTWNGDNLPLTINGPGGNSAISYGPDQQRYLQSAVDASNNITTTTYINGVFEVVSTGSTIQYRHDIVADGKTVAVHIIDQSGDVSTDYLHFDHLGSVDAVTNDQGAITQVMSFDAFGLRRDAANWAYDLSGAQIGVLKNDTDRGYTFQEQLDDVGLVHMNGRAYDPLIGRFISADSAMGENRYAYVDNNPLSRTDPSGHCFVCLSSITNPVSILTGIPMPTSVAQDIEHAVRNGLSIASHPSEFFADTNPIVGTQINEFMARSSVARQIGGIAAMVVSCWFGPEVYAGYQAYITDLEGGSPLQDAIAGGEGYLEAESVGKIFSDGLNPMGDGVGWSALGQDLANQAENYADRRLAMRLAQHYGINLTRLDEYLTVFSIVGTEIVGSRYTSNFEGTGQPGITGYFSQGGGFDSWKAWAGLPVDISDTILGYQGLPDGTAYDMMYETEFGGVDEFSNIQSAHSLGTITYRNLANLGLTDSAHLYALPFGLTGPVGSQVTMEYGDGVSGFSGNFLFNWGAIGCSGWEHTYTSFQSGTTSDGSSCAP